MAFRNLPEMPCGPVLELHGQRKRFHVPYGLKRLIEDMTREVLRYQPSNIFEFLAVFMESRLQRRLKEEEKNQKRKSWESHRWSWQGGSILEPEDLREFLEQLPVPEEEVNHHAVVIQAAFRGYQARKKVKEIKKSIGGQDEGTRKVSMAVDAKRESNDSKDDGTLRKKRNTLDITQATATDEELHSAVIIQAAFRGMHARNEVKKLRASMGGGDGRKSQPEAGRQSLPEEGRRSQPGQGQAQNLQTEAPGGKDQEKDAALEKERKTSVGKDQGKEAVGNDKQQEIGASEVKDQGKEAAVNDDKQKEMDTTGGQDLGKDTVGENAKEATVQENSAVTGDKENNATGETDTAAASTDKQKEMGAAGEGEEEEEG